MNETISRKLGLSLSFAISLFLFPVTGRCQQPSKPESTEASADVHALLQTLHELQGEVQSLHAQLDQLRSEQQQSRAEAATLRREVHLAIGENSPAFSSTL